MFAADFATGFTSAIRCFSGADCFFTALLLGLEAALTPFTLLLKYGINLITQSRAVTFFRNRTQLKNIVFIICQRAAA